MYQVIARKYRPQTFEDLIGQEPVRTTLENAIRTSRLAHGYIFAGQRGTGKTTVARILARCLNCVKGPTGQPCGECASCLEITAGNSPDVIEIDAASNRGINEMRELRENVRYRPARDRYKVFIIDEAHQITNEAFNALLKTLEEPPEWAVFVLCTTEVHKVPNTIASRCQQFSFRSVQFDELMERLEFIAKQEGVDADQDVLAVIANAGEGSVRDSLSALDQAIACCGKTLRVDEVRALLGVFALDSLQAIADAAREQNGEKMLEVVQELERTGQSLQHFCRELARYWRNLLVAKIAGKPTRLIAASEREQQAMAAVAAGFTEEDLTRYLQLTLDLYKTLQFSLQPRLHLELGLIKLVQVGKLQSIEEAISQLGADAPPPLRASAPAPRTGIAKLAPSGRTLSAPPEPRQPAASAAHPAIALEREPGQTNGSAQQNTGDFKTDLHAALTEAGMKMSADAVQHADVRVEGAEIVFTSAKSFMLGLKDSAVAKAASALLGRLVKVRVEIDANMTAPTGPPPGSERNEAQLPTDNNVTQRALSHPGVKRFQELFPGAHVRAVRNLNE
ncbi:MAG TPA: DNA polymerase III subunit gamma/tau [Bryobacteraceae bacterium]|nr:DNA polymerase III subunit gamma/tau [Bryobacteraceae bacterium]